MWTLREPSASRRLSLCRRPYPEGGATPSGIDTDPIQRLYAADRPKLGRTVVIDHG